MTCPPRFSGIAAVWHVKGVVMAGDSRKKALIALLKRGRQEEHLIWGQFTAAEQAAHGTLDNWALKDLAAHISEWKDRDASRLDAARQDRAPEGGLDFDSANLEIFEAHRNKTWAEVMDLEKRAFEHLLASVEAHPESALLDTESVEWTGGRSLAWIAAFTGYYHPHAHVSEFLAKRGDYETAEAIQIRILEAMDSLDDSPRARGTNLYNLACFYALNGVPERALENLSKSFALWPELVEWSTQDADIDSLRGMPAYEALIQAPPPARQG